MGSYQHNQRIRREGKGELAVVYRPSAAIDVSGPEYVPCQFCFGTFRRMQLWRHQRKCSLKPDGVNGALRAVVAGDLLANTDSASGKSSSVEKLISSLRHGPQRTLIQHDMLLKRLAGKLLCRVGHAEHHKMYIRGRLRKIARVLLHIRHSNSHLSNADLKSVLKPRHFQTVLAAVRAVSGYSDSDHGYKTPSLAIQLGKDLKKCAMILKSMAIEEDDEVTAKHAESFVNLCSSDWNDEVSGGARQQLRVQKANKPKLLPVASDVIKLNSHLKNIQIESMSIVKNGTMTDDEFAGAFRSLSETVLAQLILFNRKRQGEVSKLKISVYHQAVHEKRAVNSDAVDSLSPLEKELCSNFIRIEVAGKRNNIVPILITRDQKRMIELLTDSSKRSWAGIVDCNPYVFAAGRGSVECIRGCDVIRDFANACGAENPMLLRSTNLRKHVATLSQILNLKEHELEQLAKFLGHDIRIHRNFYRLPNEVIQTAKVSRILLAMETGNISKYSGKTLDEIDIHDDDGN
jgi:hypothetical protein